MLMVLPICTNYAIAFYIYLLTSIQDKMKCNLLLYTPFGSVVLELKALYGYKWNENQVTHNFGLGNNRFQSLNALVSVFVFQTYYG